MFNEGSIKCINCGIVVYSRFGRCCDNQKYPENPWGDWDVVRLNDRLYSVTKNGETFYCEHDQKANGPSLCMFNKPEFVR